jgi:hypothetical protein
MIYDSTSPVREIMQEFARVTGLSVPGAPPQRYLWTDAFAVCNFIGLYRRTNDTVFRDLVLMLVDQVHTILGRHRDDDPRIGWISGLNEQEGKLHPTVGGLRIGKRLNERREEEPPDERLEWDRDGQYYHYLTKWMHALNRVSRITGDPVYTVWAIEMAKTAHSRFTYVSAGGKKRMVWKMNIDLSRPLVSSMGQHDPLDGIVTFSELQNTAAANQGKMPHLNLRPEITDLAGMCRGRDWATDDPLGIGGLLFDASRIGQLMVRGGFGYPDLLGPVLGSALQGMEFLSRSSPLRAPPAYRLAFRELGLSIGLRGLEGLSGLVGNNPGIFDGKSFLSRKIMGLMKFEPIAEQIEQFWLDEKNQEAATWKEHREINRVMLATSLAPEEFLAV